MFFWVIIATFVNVFCWGMSLLPILCNILFSVGGNPLTCNLLSNAVTFACLHLHVYEYQTLGSCTQTFFIEIILAKYCDYANITICIHKNPNCFPISAFEYILSHGKENFVFALQQEPKAAIYRNDFTNTTMQVVEIINFQVNILR